MDYSVDVGRYRSNIIGNNELIKLIPCSWLKQKTLQNVTPGMITIHLELASDIDIYKMSDGWTVLKDSRYSEAAYVQKGKIIFILQPRTGNEIVVYVRKALESYVRIGIHYGLMVALHCQCVGMHGVTLVCGNEIIILSAPSGTGKTTLAKLLEKYCDAIVINGDFALLSPTEDGVIFEPTPFCGTSGRALNHRFRVNRVVFLGQAKENQWRDLDGREAMTRFMSNAFVPEWDSGMQQAVQGNILRCMDMLKVNAFDFAPTQEAAEMFVEHLIKS